MDKLTMNTSENHVVARSFSSSFIVCPTLLFSSQKSKNIEKSLFNFNLEVPVSCSEESSVGTTSLSLILSWSPLVLKFQMKVFQKEFQLMN